MNTNPLTPDEVSRFKQNASLINFDGLDIQDQLAGKATLAGLLLNDTALANAPKAIDALKISAPLKKVFSDAFDAARVPLTTASGTQLPNTDTVKIAAALLGVTLGIGLALYLID